MSNPPLEQDAETTALENSDTTMLIRPTKEGVHTNGRRVGNILCELEHALYRLVITPLVAFLPAPFAYSVACLRGDWRYRLDGHTREVVMRNLEDVLG